MSHTLKLLHPECQISNQSEVIRELQEKLNLQTSNNRPMLFEIVDQLFVDQDEASQNQGLAYLGRYRVYAKHDRKEDRTCGKRGNLAGI